MGIWGPRYLLYHIRPHSLEVDVHKLSIEQPNINYRTGSESAQNRDPEESESTVFYRTFVLLIPFYNCGNSCNFSSFGSFCWEARHPDLEPHSWARIQAWHIEGLFLRLRPVLIMKHGLRENPPDLVRWSAHEHLVPIVFWACHVRLPPGIPSNIPSKFH